MINNIEYRVARSRDELEQAYGLVYQEYLKRGYIDESPSRLRLSVYNLLPQTTTFVAVYEGVVTATATLIPDSPLGLPMDEIYAQELALFRKHGKAFCEVSMLASHTDLFREGASMMLNAKKMFFVFFLFKRIFDYAREVLKMDYIVITINPKHRMTYEYLHFTDIGGLKNYSKVNGAPALGKCLNIQTVGDKIKEEKGNPVFKMFFAGKSDPTLFENRFQWKPEDIRYFFMQKTDELLKTSEKERQYLQQCYPAYDWPSLTKSVATS